MPRFTLKQLLASTTLISAGFTVLISAQAYRDWNALRMGLWFVSGPAIGCGALTPLGRPWLGLAIGTAIQLLVLCVAL
jgi:hypothetical protein